jgi:hypothetical protein
MPVLTCPFQTIKKQELENAAIQYPASVTLSTELLIKPVAGETWSVEGLTLQFTTKYEAAYFVNTSVPYAALINSREFLKGSKVFQEALIVKLGKELTFNEGAVTQAIAANTEGGETHAKAVVVEQAHAAVEATHAAIETAHKEVEGINREIEGISREIKELGKTVGFEGSKDAPLIVIARMFARGNELIWENNLSPLRFQSEQEYANASVNKYIAVSSIWNETFNFHVQFDDPIDFTERENLKLTLEFISPANPKEIGGGLEGNVVFGNVTLSVVTAIVNYSHSMAGEQ